MFHTRADQTAVPDFDAMEPTAAELDAIEAEMPVIEAEVELLDVRIALMDRPLYPIDARRVRRAEHRLLTERARLAGAVKVARGVSA